MSPSEFEALLANADLNPRRANIANGIAFSVSHHVPIEIPRLDGTVVRSLRIQCDMLSYEPSALAKMTVESSQSQIEALKKKLERAAKTKQGITR